MRLVYDSGLEYNSGQPVEELNIRCIGYDPLVYEDGQEGVVLTETVTVANADFIIRRNAGTWANISTEFNNAVHGIILGDDGLIYLAGAFTDVGDANGDGLLSWNPETTTLSSLSTGTGGSVDDAVKAPNGDIYICGGFTNVGDANGDRVAYWDVSGSTFASLAADIDNSTAYAIEFGHDGTLYVGGGFINVVDSSGDGIVKWNGSAFSSMGSGCNNTVSDIKVHPDGKIYVGGGFTSAGGGSSVGIAYWDPSDSSWNDVSTAGVTGGNANVWSIAIDKNGLVYIGGSFTAAGGVSCANVAVWNGSTFEPLGAGQSDQVYRLYLTNDGLLYASGLFGTGNNIWNGTTWTTLDVDLPGSPTIDSLLQYRDNLYIGYNTAGSATAANLDSPVNNGTTITYPVIKIKRSGGTSSNLRWMKNETTGATINFTDYALLDGETLTLDFRPGKRGITSSMFGSRWGAIARNSAFTDFNFLPGTNNITLYALNAGAPTITATAVWDLVHWSVDGVAA
jgi:hypothetical protein